MDKDLLAAIAAGFLGRDVEDEIVRDTAGRLHTVLRWVRGVDPDRLRSSQPAGALNLLHGGWRLPGPAEPAYATVRPTGAGTGYGAPPGHGAAKTTPEQSDRGHDAGAAAIGRPPDNEGPFTDRPSLGVVAGQGGLAGMPAVEVAAGFRRREWSPVEVIEATLDRIGALDSELGTFITVMADSARADAAAAQRALMAGEPTGLLCGIPVAVKDIIETAGVRTTCGSRILRDHVPSRDATVVRRLRQAGAVIVGKTNTHEFAFGPTTINPHYGPCRNPHNPSRVSGGSSGGSAAAVASGQAALALGTDTGGSIRIPAAACGIVGLKPTYGRVSKAGVFPLSWSLDHVGPLARTVADAALLLTVLAGPDAEDHSTLSGAPTDDWVAAAGRTDGGLRGLRVGLPKGWEDYRVSDAMRGRLGAVARRMEHLGAEVREIEFPAADAMMLANRLLILAESAAYHLPWLFTRPGDYGADVRARLELGQYLLASDYLIGHRLRTELTQAVAGIMREVDLVVTASLPAGAPYIGQHHFVWADGLESVPDGLIRFPAPFNVTGQPALTLPCGSDDDGLPLGVQIVGRAFEEATVLRAAAVLEADFAAGGLGGD